jgi:hypothetical protein
LRLARSTHTPTQIRRGWLRGFGEMGIHWV